MSQFAPAFEYLMNFEDRGRTFAVNIDNNGGEVIAGINSKSFPAQVAAIKFAPQSQRPALVYQFYLTEFWMRLRLGCLNSQDVANRVLDMDVNAGEVSADSELQKAICEVKSGACEVDGVIGPITIAAANSVDPEQLLLAFRAQRVSHYEEIAAAHPEDEEFLKGWLARAEA